MTERLSEILERIDNVRQLDAVVRAMRGMAAARAQQSRGLLRGIEAYAESVSNAIGDALTFVPATPSPPTAKLPRSLTLILFCAEEGFAGAFTDRVLDAAGPKISENRVFIVGTRGAAIARERGAPIHWTTAMSTQIGGVPTMANRVADALYTDIVGGTTTSTEVLYPRMDAERRLRIEQTMLFPLDLESFRRPRAQIRPLLTLNPETLLERLAAEYIYARLCEAAMHAFAAENQARFEAMSSATGNIARMLRGLTERANQERQEEVTAEIVELAAEHQRWA